MSEQIDYPYPTVEQIASTGNLRQPRPEEFYSELTIQPTPEELTLESEVSESFDLEDQGEVVV